MKYYYRPLLRPASHFTLPQGLVWDYVEAPAGPYANRPELPKSIHPFGVIAFDRKLTLAETEAFDLLAVNEPVSDVSDAQIEALLSEQDGGDLAMTALCQIALYGSADAKVIRQLTRAEKDSIDARMAAEGGAREACARVIAEAQAQEDEFQWASGFDEGGDQ